MTHSISMQKEIYEIEFQKIITEHTVKQFKMFKTLIRHKLTVKQRSHNETLNK